MKLNRNCHSAQTSFRSLLLEESFINKKVKTIYSTVTSGYKHKKQNQIMKGAENMTVSKNPTSLKLSMDVENGTNALGAMQTKSTSVGSVRLDAEAAKCLAVTEAIGELMSHAVVNVYVTEKAELDKAE
ncbi:hypothetical protein [Phascolarctobacterium faecium]